MKLIKPDAKYLEAYKQALEEDKLFRPQLTSHFSDPDLIIEKAHRYEQGIDLKPGYVSATTLWLMDEDQFIGEVNIRHALTPHLLNYGGHIGYEVRYTACNKGYGKKMLALALIYARDVLKLSFVLITCDDTNIPSIKVIESNGGMLENKVNNVLEIGRVLTRRYWISLVD